MKKTEIRSIEEAVSVYEESSIIKESKGQVIDLF